MVDFQALVGDSADNVPGVAGVGVKTAAQLLSNYGTLENILANVKEIEPLKKREAIQGSMETVSGSGGGSGSSSSSSSSRGRGEGGGRGGGGRGGRMKRWRRREEKGKLWSAFSPYCSVYKSG